MPDRRAFLSIVIVAAASTGLLAAGPSTPSTPGAGSRGIPSVDYVPQIDGPLSTCAGPGGLTWAAWGYRSSREFDIAIAVRDGAGAWSAPVFLGRRDGIDEVEPAIAVDANGTVYVAFATRAPARVALAILPVGATAWSEPSVISGVETASSPAVRIVRDRLVVAYRTPRGLRIADLATWASANEVRGIQDGPDGVDPLGMSAPSGTGGSSGGNSNGSPASGDEHGNSDKH